MTGSRESWVYWFGGIVFRGLIIVCEATFRAVCMLAYVKSRGSRIGIVNVMPLGRVARC